MSRVVGSLLSVRGRITLVVTALFALAMALGGWFLLDRAEQAWIDDIRAADLAELELLAADIMEIEELGAGAFSLPVGVDGTSFELLDESGELIAATPAAVFSGFVTVEGPIVGEQLPSPLVQDPLVTAYGLVEPGEVISVSLPVELFSGDVVLTASSSLEPVRAGVSALRGLLWVAIPTLVVAVGATSWFVTGRAFRPVEDITERVDRITDDNLDERVPVPSSRDEVARLATTMNKMLDRLSASRQRQRRFVSDASHELRNPIAASKTRLEVSLAHPDRVGWEEAAGSVLQEQERLERLVDSLLQLARLDEQAISASEEVDLDDLVFAEAQRIEDRPISLDRVNPARVAGNRPQLTHAVRNLLDNATRHASSEVAVGLGIDGDQAVLTVDDDGPGVPIGQRAAVFERFVRLDESRERSRGGAGLGLALVSAVADAHHGTVALGDSPLGGARFELRVPLAHSVPGE